MLIYEVTLEVDRDIEPTYVPWLEHHAREMLQFEGFERASVTRRSDAPASDRLTFVVHYYVRSQNDLDAYFGDHAERMRADGAKRFPGKFEASRRVLQLEKELSVDP